MKSDFTYIKMLIWATIISALFINCEGKKIVNDPYTEEIEEWRKNRESRLLEPDGWLSLVGLHWLEEGENKFGSDKSNDIVFIDKAPAFIGSFILEDSIVSISIKDDVEVLLDSVSVKEAEMSSDNTGNPSIFTTGSLSWYLIKRAGERYGIRVKDAESELIRNFEGLEYYPIDPAWKIEADFMEYNPPKKVLIPNIIGTSEEIDSPGKLVFTIDGNEFSLDVQDSGRRFFVIFADQTNGEETYGAGRFITVDKPDSTGKTFIDFNLAYNPPCIFTKYATCPLPPKDNMLKVEIKAGEKNYGEGH